ncbi:MAG: hypothetical protein IT232_00880 [Flavobacteriales bacterium]|nr:hypothetical protein [Flavobacteriales bacterium]
MKKLSFKLISIAIVSSAIIYSCGGNEEPKEVEETTTEEVKVDENETTYVLPSPLQIVNLFKSAGLEYVGSLTNPIDNANKYNDKSTQKVNFGIFSADMAYAITNNQTQEAINYLNALRKMSEKIWMTDIINCIGLAGRLEKNVGNEDSLTSIMADLQMDMDQYLEENGSSNTGSVIFAGAWIESMYLALNANKNSNEKLNNRLAEQSIIVSNIINAVKQANEDGSLNNLVSDLEKINTSLSATDANGALTPEKLNELKTTVTDIRNNITKG